MNLNNNKYQLPNGQWIEQINTYETDFVFNEIFVNKIYLKHGIKLQSDAIVFDIGANIGLFSLYIKENFPKSTIFAFEPSPMVYPILEKNLSCFDKNVHSYNVGLGNNENEQPFHYYPGYSVISGFNADKQKNIEIILSGMKTNQPTEDLKTEALVKKRFEQENIFQCRVTTLSNIIQQNTIAKVDLLKIDVEGSELAILQGIQTQHWKKIQQIVMEVHNPSDLQIITHLLKTHLFNVHVEEDLQLKTSGIYNLYARQKTYEN
jgi:FkbM family methyltransferase